MSTGQAWQILKVLSGNDLFALYECGSQLPVMVKNLVAERLLAFDAEKARVHEDALRVLDANKPKKTRQKKGKKTRPTRSVSEAQKQATSVRMKKYWAKRRKEKAKK